MTPKKHLLERKTRDGDAGSLLDQLYGGEILFGPGTPAASALAQNAMGAVAQAFQDLGDPRLAQFELSNEEFFGRIKELRREFYSGEEWRTGVLDVIAAAGVDPERTAYDPLKLRVVQSGGAKNPLAAPVFQAHRDVWYSHPSCLVTWWIALHDASEDETFAFYPGRLDQPVPNDSEAFDYSDWTKDGPDLKIGWQDIHAGKTAVFPCFQGSIEDEAHGEVGFAPKGGDELMFAGAHLHRTRAQESGRTRFSVDFRIIDTVHAAEGRGAPLVDARCRGSAVADYLPAS